jgi:hypothetical protein
MKTSTILMQRSKSDPCLLIWKLSKWNFRERKLDSWQLGIIRMNLERAGFKNLGDA